MNKLLDHYLKLVEFLGHVLGENAEIVLQDLSGENKSIIAIANEQITERKVGSPLTDYALSVIRDESWKEADYVCNYEAVADGKKLRSSTFFIKDQGELIGMLCINIDNHKYMELAQELLELGGFGTADHVQYSRIEDVQTEKEEPVRETLSASIDEMVLDQLNEYIIEKNHLPVDHFGVDDKIEVVKRMERKGLFLMKGTVSIVADHLMCSEASIYRYLTKISK